MVDLQRLELEKKRYKRESVSLVVAAAALILSVVATWFAVQPTLQQSTERADATLKYLTGLSTAGVNDALGANTYAEPSSPASVFANVVARWRQAQRENDALGDVAGGSVEKLEDGSYSLCLPTHLVPLFPNECVSISNFDYSQDNELREFTIDDIPTGSLVRSVSTSDLADGGTGPVRIYLEAAVISPDGSSVTLVYSLNRRREADRQYPVSFSKVTYQDDKEQETQALQQYFPSQIGYWEASPAVIQVPREVKFMFLCWDGVQDARGTCDWTYGTGMR